MTNLQQSPEAEAPFAAGHPNDADHADGDLAITAADDGAVRRFRASTYDEALAAATDELGHDVQVLEANRIRRGGLGGFFATDLGVEISVISSTDDPGEPPGSSASPVGRNDYMPTPSPARGRNSFAEHLAFERSGAHSVLPGTMSQDGWTDGPDESTLSPSAVAELERRTALERRAEQVNAAELLAQPQKQPRPELKVLPAAESPSPTPTPAPTPTPTVAPRLAETSAPANEARQAAQRVDRVAARGDQTAGQRDDQTAARIDQTAEVQGAAPIRAKAEFEPTIPPRIDRPSAPHSEPRWQHVLRVEQEAVMTDENRRRANEHQTAMQSVSARRALVARELEARTPDMFVPFVVAPSASAVIAPVAGPTIMPAIPSTPARHAVIDVGVVGAPVATAGATGSVLDELDEMLRSVGVVVPAATPVVSAGSPQDQTPELAIAAADNRSGNDSTDPWIARMTGILAATEGCSDHVRRLSVAMTSADGTAMKMTANLHAGNLSGING